MKRICVLLVLAFVAGCAPSRPAGVFPEQGPLVEHPAQLADEEAAVSDNRVLLEKYLTSSAQFDEGWDFTDAERELGARLLDADDEEFYDRAWGLSLGEKLTYIEYFRSASRPISDTRPVQEKPRLYRKFVRESALRGMFPFGHKLHEELLAIIKDSDCRSALRVSAILEYSHAFLSLSDGAMDRELKDLVQEVCLLEKDVKIREISYRTLTHLSSLTEDNNRFFASLLFKETDIFLKERLAHDCLSYGFVCGMLPLANVENALYSEDPETFLSPEEFSKSYLRNIPQEYLKDWPTFIEFLRKNISKLELQDREAVSKHEEVAHWTYKNE